MKVLEDIKKLGESYGKEDFYWKDNINKKRVNGIILKKVVYFYYDQLIRDIEDWLIENNN